MNEGICQSRYAGKDMFVITSFWILLHFAVFGFVYTCITTHNNTYNVLLTKHSISSVQRKVNNALINIICQKTLPSPQFIQTHSLTMFH